MINSITLVGRLTKDPELRYTQAGKGVASFTIACDRPFKNQQGEKETDFINVVVWGNQAENCANYLTKGKLAGVEGRLQIRTYEGNDGQKKWVTEVVANRVAFLSPKDNSQQHGAPDRQPGEDDIPF
jgi:single-strand DNA-binding protein